MIADRDIETAAQVLAKCAANDPWFPKGGQAIVQAWAEVFAESKLSREDLLAGVARAYRTEETGYRPLPASIVKHARAAYFEALRDLPEEERERMDHVNHALQDMGFAPPAAHRFARRIALGRRPEVGLTDDEKVELRRRLAERAAIEEAPRRAVVVSPDFGKRA
ncbi:hypothetical protein GS481_02325 [Rhodococcus hoagii]|nr:hypothetical protein [Prescottella equi]NKR53007.1 hypothetical protein [Prescottella equi]